MILIDFDLSKADFFSRFFGWAESLWFASFVAFLLFFTGIFYLCEDSYRCLTGSRQKKTGTLSHKSSFFLLRWYVQLVWLLLEKFSFLTLFKNVILISRTTTREFSTSCSRQISRNDDVWWLGQRKSQRNQVYRRIIITTAQ